MPLLPEEPPCSSIETANLARSPPPDGLKRTLNQWRVQAKPLFSLKPVTFRYKNEIDPAGTPQFGLVAEEVEKVNLDLVVRDKEGKPYSVRYDAVNAMLLNEFLKEHRTVRATEANHRPTTEGIRDTLSSLPSGSTNRQRKSKR